ncbi:MAG: endonuclease domain-containing protein [Actinomycetota bacterium]
MPQASTESALEAIVWRLLLDGGLPPPVRQYEVRDVGGKLVARVDFAYPEALIAIEADGHEFHSSRRDWQRERTRQNALIRLGWRIYRVTWGDATRRPRLVVADIGALLADFARRRVVSQEVRHAYVLGHNFGNRAEPDP